LRFKAIPIDILEKSRTGQDGGFEELCTLARPGMYGVLFNLLHNHDDTDDALQECLVRVYKYLPSLQNLSSFSGWMMRILVNQAMTSLADRNRMGKVETRSEEFMENAVLLANASPAISPRASAESYERKNHIQQAIDGLPPKQRLAILLFELEDMSISEISALLECSTGTVKFNLHEARKKLKAALAPDYGETAKTPEVTHP
jgi:RNA polymerase sigma-70 factor (ECF subfamily)